MEFLFRSAPKRHSNPGTINYPHQYMFFVGTAREKLKGEKTPHCWNIAKVQETLFSTAFYWPDDRTRFSIEFQVEFAVCSKIVTFQLVLHCILSRPINQVLATEMLESLMIIFIVVQIERSQIGISRMNSEEDHLRSQRLAKKRFQIVPRRIEQ